MCQLCQVKEIAERARWVNTLLKQKNCFANPHQPNPLVPSVTTIRQTVSSTHGTVTSWLSVQAQLHEKGVDLKDLDDESCKPILDMRQKVQDSVELLLRICTELEECRIGWWNGKSAQRKEWLETGNSNLTGINKINNATIEMTRDVRQRIGQFCRYTLNVSAEDLEKGPGLGGENDNEHSFD